MRYTVNHEDISAIIFFIKSLFINIGAYYIFLKLANQKNSIKVNFIAVVEVIFVTCLYTIMRGKTTLIDAMFF